MVSEVIIHSVVKKKSKDGRMECREEQQWDQVQLLTDTHIDILDINRLSYTLSNSIGDLGGGGVVTMEAGCGDVVQSS